MLDAVDMCELRSCGLLRHVRACAPAPRAQALPGCGSKIQIANAPRPCDCYTRSRSQTTARHPRERDTAGVESSARATRQPGPNPEPVAKTQKSRPDPTRPDPRGAPSARREARTSHPHRTSSPAEEVSACANQESATLRPACLAPNTADNSGRRRGSRAEPSRAEPVCLNAGRAHLGRSQSVLTQDAPIQ
jgi:hypothetical protein